MSIASAITAAQGRVANAYTAVSGMGGTLPQVQNLTNLPTAIQSISTVNNQNKTITENGEYTADDGYTGLGTVTVIVPEGDEVSATNRTGTTINEGEIVYINKVGNNYELVNLYTPGRWYQNFMYTRFPIHSRTTGITGSFSTENYICLLNPFNPYLNTWEVQIKATTGNDVTSNQKFLHSCKGTGGSGRYGIGIIIINGKFGFFSSADGSSWLFDVQGTYSVQTNTTYWLKAGWDGSKYYLEYSTDGEIYTRDIEVSNATATYGSLIYTYIGIMSNDAMQNPFLGTIDLSETKIVVNNEDWWVPEYQHAYNKTINGQLLNSSYFTSNIVQIPTLDYWFNATNFSDSANFYAPHIYVQGLNKRNCTIYMRIKTPSGGSGDKNFLSGDWEMRYNVSTNRFRVYTGASSSVINLMSGSQGHWYDIKYISNGTSRTFMISTDGGSTWTASDWTDNEEDASNILNLAFGMDLYTSGHIWSNGVIDFYNTYIESDNNVVWTGVENHIASESVNSGTLTGIATESIADGATGVVKTVLGS